MKHVRSLGFEALETRQLLSALSQGEAPSSPGPASLISLDGTLKVSYCTHGSPLRTNPDGSKARSLQVIGELGSMGRVHGVWKESVDMFGNYDGPDTLHLSSPRGSIDIAFFNQNSPRGVARLGTSVTYLHSQEVYSGAGAYAGASETGTIQVTTSPYRPRVVSLTLQTTST
jgi:hypothetical protein